MTKRKVVLIIVLALLVSVSSCTAGYLIGRPVNLDRYTGRIIDTITITPSQAEEGFMPVVYRVVILGRVLYTDGNPYRNGTIELKSEVRYTTTDEYGRFVFGNVPEGRHRVSVIEDGVVLAYCDVIIEGSIYLTTVQMIRLDDGSYLVQVPLDILVIELMLELDKEGSKLEIKGVRGHKADNYGDIKPDNLTDGIGDPESNGLPDDTDVQETEGLPDDTGDPSLPGIPEMPGDILMPEGLTCPDCHDLAYPILEESISSEGIVCPFCSCLLYPAPKTPVKPGASDKNGNEPYIVVTDDINPLKAWTKKTTADIFAERPENYGVRKIDGKSVIVPGAKGKYIFRIRNPEAGSVLYWVKFSENDRNNPPLQMKYRLKLGVSGHEYIDGDAWKSAGDIAVNAARLDAGEDVFYTLEWKWDTGDDELDTAIGSQKERPAYMLEIVVNAIYE